MGRQHEITVFVPPRQPSHNVAGMGIPPDPGHRVKLYGDLLLPVHEPFQHCRIRPGNGERRCILRARDILGIQRFLVHIAVAAVLNSDQRPGTFAFRLIHRVVDPPFLPLVDADQHQLARHIQPFIVRSRSPAHVHQRKYLRPVGDKMGLVGPQLKMMGRPARFLHRQFRPFKLPGIHVDAVTGHVRKTDALHFPGQELSGLPLCCGTGRPVAQGRVASKFLQLFCQVIRISDIQRLQIILFCLFHCRLAPPFCQNLRISSSASLVLLSMALITT